jgi:hypothetical protein
VESEMLRGQKGLLSETRSLDETTSLKKDLTLDQATLSDSLLEDKRKEKKIEFVALTTR